MSENSLQNLIRIELSKQGFTVFRANVIGAYTKDGRYIPPSLPKGFSDLFAIKDGKIYFFEVKFGKNKVSPEQLNFITQMQAKGCVAEVVYSMEEVLKCIQ